MAWYKKEQDHINIISMILDKMGLFCQFSRQQHCTFSLLVIFFLFTDEIQCHDNPEALSINNSSCVHKAANIVYSAFTVHLKSTRRTLRVRSALTYRSTGTVERFRDCTYLSFFTFALQMYKLSHLECNVCKLKPIIQKCVCFFPKKRDFFF